MRGSIVVRNIAPPIVRPEGSGSSAITFSSLTPSSTPPMQRYLPFLAVLLACSAGAADTLDSGQSVRPQPTAATSPKIDSAAGTREPPTRQRRPGRQSPQYVRLAPADLPIVRGLYVNRFAAQSTKRMRKLIAIADSTEVNAFVIDVKDEFGLNIPSQDPHAAEERRQGGSDSERAVSCWTR